MGTFDLRSFGALAIFPKTLFPKHFFVYKSQPKFIKLYLFNGPHKTTFSNFKLKTILLVFVNMGSNNGSANLKHYSSFKLTAKRFQTCLDFFSQWSSPHYDGDVINFKFPIFFSKISNSPLYPMRKSKNLKSISGKRVIVEQN